MNHLEVQSMKVAATLKLLAHPKRLLILCKLSEGEQSVSDLELACEISQSQLSQFLIKMKEDGLITSRKEGLFVFYAIQDTKISLLLQSLTEIYCNNQC
jgi:DNA-binding transcriptional ArsR family regulator